MANPFQRFYRFITGANRRVAAMPTADATVINAPAKPTEEEQIKKLNCATGLIHQMPQSLLNPEIFRQSISTEAKPTATAIINAINFDAQKIAPDFFRDFSFENQANLGYLIKSLVAEIKIIPDDAQQQLLAINLQQPLIDNGAVNANENAVAAIINSLPDKNRELLKTVTSAALHVVNCGGEAKTFLNLDGLAVVFGPNLIEVSDLNKASMPKGLAEIIFTVAARENGINIGKTRTPKASTEHQQKAGNYSVQNEVPNTKISITGITVGDDGRINSCERLVDKGGNKYTEISI